MSVTTLEPWMRRVYRIQTANGVGPYGTSWGNSPADPTIHPGPFSEPSLRWEYYNMDEWFFGFATMKQLERWFYDPMWRVQMHEAGLHITVWEVPAESFRYSRTQAIFIRDEATLVGEQSLIH